MGTMTEKNELFPIFLKANQLRVLVIGAGQVGLEKLKAIVAQSPGCRIRLVAEEITPESSEYVRQNPQIGFFQREVLDDDFSESHIVISAINDLKKAEELKKRANEKGLLFNSADNPELCDFYLSSVVNKGHVKIAISTNGKSPTLAKRLKEVLQNDLPNNISKSAEELNTLRNYLKGDFRKKVNKLNKQTALLIEKKSKPWYEFSVKRVLIAVFTVLGLMIAGHIFFTLLPPEEIWKSFNSMLDELDASFLYFMLGGFIAQMIDGALGMAYGVSATTFLLALGVSPAVASMSVHTSEVVTSGVSGIMHLRFGNVNNRLFKNIVVPGVIGAIIGAYLLSEFENYSDYIKPIVSTYTLFLGALIIYKVVRKKQVRKKVTRVGWLATLGGFLDSIGGGGWGPVVSSTLIARGKNPRMIVGSVNLAEFFVSLASSFTFFTILGTVAWQPILGLILGGVCAAPIAAYLTSRLNIKVMMLFVGIIVIIVSLRNIFVVFF